MNHMSEQKETEKPNYTIKSWFYIYKKNLLYSRIEYINTQIVIPTEIC